jgi:hypothetical protein
MVVFFPLNKNNYYVNSTLFHHHHHRLNIIIIIILVLPVLGPADSLFNSLIDMFLTVIILRVDRRTSQCGRYKRVHNILHIVGSLYMKHSYKICNNNVY